VTKGRLGLVWVMFGWRLIDKSFFTLTQHWSGAVDKRVGFALMPEWMATRILALLLGLSGGFAAHYTLLILESSTDGR
jgi:hypothetical protein